MNQEKESNYNPLLKYLDKIFFAVASLYLGLVIHWINQPNPLVQAKEKQTNVSNSQFIAYLKQSLKVIKATPLNTPSPLPSPNIPLEKVYIPRYPPKPNKVTSIPVPPKPNKVISIPVPPKPNKVTSIPVPPKPNKLKSIPRPPKPYVTPKQLDIMLTGVLESGINSAALFSFKGITKRLQTGDLVGSSGWVFQGVTEQKAVLLKGGKTRYIEVGQKL